MNGIQSQHVQHRNRRISALILAAMLVVISTEVTAFDIRGLIPGMSAAARREAAVEARQQKQQQKQEEEARSCAQLKSWFDAGPLPLPAGSYPRTMGEINQAVMVLIEDGRFSSAFGKTYDRMTPQELQQLVRDVVPLCVTNPSGPLGGAYGNLRSVVYQAFNSGLQANYVLQLNNARSATAETASLTAEVQTLQPTEEGHSRLMVIRQAGDAAAAKAARPQAEAYAKAMAEAQQRVVAPVESAQVKAAVATANGYDGLVQLSKLYADLEQRGTSNAGTRVNPQTPYARKFNPDMWGHQQMPDDGTPNPAIRENLQTLDTRMNEIGMDLSAIERSRINALGQGLVGLERGVQWQADYNQRFRRFATQVRPLGELQGYFNTKRQATLAAASNEFRQEVRHAGSEAQLVALQRRYLLASDDAMVSGTQLLTAIAEQQREIEKREALGASLDAERREAAASTSPQGNPAAAQQPKASESAAGEPSQEVMYDLVRQRYEDEAARIKDLERSCSGSQSMGAMNTLGGSTDAVLCLSVGLVGGVGADQPLKITHFEKLGCALASGKPGYYCEFDYTVTGGPSKFLGPITQSLTGEGGVGNARFLRKGGSWIMIYRTQD
ncbi:MAG: hypothetical protein WBX11_12030 [Thiobacillaceae bacterium]